MSMVKARVAVIREGGTWDELQVDVEGNPNNVLGLITEAEQRARLTICEGTQELPKGTLGVHYIGIVGGWPG